MTVSAPRPRLFVHIGPFKTGTTSVQEYFWRHRKTYLKDHGLLYPKTGMIDDAWGHRHLRLAKQFRPDVWARLIAEIKAAAPSRILVSSERLSTSLAHLSHARPLIAEYDPTLILVLRDEAALVRSMYLQVIKGYFSDPEEQVNGQISFQEWWMKARDRYAYGRMVRQWANIFGPDRMEILVFPKSGQFDSVHEICRIMDVPLLDKEKDRNPSISPFAARVALWIGRWGREHGSRAMAVAGKLERRLPFLKRIDIPGYDPNEIRAYYRSVNAEALARFPDFARRYAQLHGTPADPA